MERTQLVVIIGVIALVGAVGIKVLSDRTTFEADLNGPVTARAEKGDGGVDAGVDTGVARGGRRRGAGAASAGGGRHGGGAAAGNRNAAGSGFRRPGEARSARSLSAGERRGSGSVGSPVRRPLGGRPGSSVAEAASEDAGRRTHENPELVDFLGSQADDVSQDPEFAGEEVALEVRTEEDSEQAIYKEGVFEPDDGGDGLKFTEDSQLTFAQAGGASGEAGTITFDVEPDWAGSDATDNSLVQIRAENQWENRLQLVKNGRYLRFILADSLGKEADISVPIDEWTPGDTHSITASWGDGRTSLFIDGRLAGQNQYQGEFNIAPNTPLHLGGDYRSSDYVGAQGVIRNFTLYRNAQHP